MTELLTSEKCSEFIKSMLNTKTPDEVLVLRKEFALKYTHPPQGNEENYQVINMWHYTHPDMAAECEKHFDEIGFTRAMALDQDSEINKEYPDLGGENQ